MGGQLLAAILFLGGNMNKIYKLIWSKTKNCWVVASELAKGHGKNKSRIKNSLLAVFVISALLAGGTADVQALTQQEKDEVKNEVAKYLLDKIAHGGEIPGAKAEYGPTSFPEAIANRIFYYDDVSNKIGEKLKHDGLTLRYFGVRPDYHEPSRDYLNRYADPAWTNVNNDGAFGKHAMALGYRAFSEADHGVAIGRSSLAGGYKRDGGYGGDGDVAIGNMAWALGDKAVSIGDKALSADKSIAIGIQAEAGANKNDPKSIQRDPKTNLPYVISDIEKMNSAIAIGRDAKAWGHQSVSIGGSAKATGKYALSFGNSAEASAMDAIAFGNETSAKGIGAIAIGSDYDSSSGGAQAYSGDTIAIGRSAMAGNENDTATAYNTVAIGREARAYGKNSIALGGTANVGDVWQKQLAEGGTAIGSSANAALENATALGYKSIAYAKDAVTLGANTRADIDGGVALGSESNVGSYASPSYGKAGKVGYDPLGAGADETSTWKATKAAVSVGNQQKDITRQIINVAAGSDNTDAVNVAQLKALQSKAWKDLVASENKLGARIATNTTSINNLSGRVRTNEGDIGRLKTDVSTNDSRIRYLYNNMPFMHYVSVKSEGMAPNEGNYKNDGASKRGAIAIGAHTSSDGDGAVALGAHSFVRGQGSVIVGENSDNYTGGLKAKEGQFDQSIILGSDNTIFAQSAENGGREDKVIGNMNRVEESHGTFVRGTGNFVYDAYNDEALTDEDKQKEQDFLDPIDGGDPTGLFQKGRSHVSVEGDGNLVSGSLYTQASGVGNEISNTDHDDGTSTPKVTYNIVTGNRNTVADSSHNLIMGDNHELEKFGGNIIIGSLTTKAATKASNVTILGNDANVDVEGGVALGTGSQAATAAGVFGYDPATDKASATDNATWKSGNGAVSVGTGEKTRQITNLAAGLADTDAVNVAQLKNAKTTVEAGDYVTVTKKTEDGKGTTYTVKGPDITVDDNLGIKDKKDGEGKTVGYELSLNKELKGLTSVSSEAFKVGDKTYINKDGINANNTTITNVAPGTKDGDAVNFKQLNDVNTQVTTNKNAIDALTPRVAANEGNITKLQKGFIVKDAGEGKANVTLGGDKEPEVTFKAAVDKTTEATADGSSLTSTVDTNRNVTYSLNMKQLKQDLGITDGPDGVMSSWKLKVKDETTPQEIKNGEAVTFDVAAADKGLTVTRDGKTIKYGIEGSKIDLDGNTSITNLSNEIEKSKIHYFSVKDLEGHLKSNYNNDGAKKGGGIAIGQNAQSNGWYSIAAGLDSKVTGNWNIAIGVEANVTAKEVSTAIGYKASVTKDGAMAFGKEAQTEAENGISIGTKAKSLANRGIAVGTNSTVDQTGGRGIAIGDGAYVGAKTQGHLGTGMSNPGDAWNPSEPYLPVADDTVAGPGKLARENSMAIGMKASAFGFQTTALGAAAEAHDTNTTAVGAAAVAKGNYSTALGKQARTFEKESTSVGHWADSRAEFATALGSNTIVYKKGGVALGFGARAYDENSIAIGSNSFAKEAVDGKAYLSDEEVKAAAGIVSVGNPAYKVGDKDFAANYRRIVNVAGGIHDNDAVNVLQLKAARTTVKAGDYATVTEGKEQGVDGTVYTVKGPTLSIDGGNLTVADAEETIAGTTDKRKIGYKLSLNKELTGLTSVSSTTFKAGNDVTLGGTGLTIANGPSVTATGIDAGSKKITNVTAGAADGDAVNFKQLKDVDSKVTTNTGDITTLKKGWTLEDGNATKGTKIVKAEDTVKVTSDDYITATVNNDGLKLGMNVTKLNTQINDQIDNSDTVKEKMKSWVLKAATTDKDPAAKGQTIDNTNNVATFDVEENQGLTVARDGATIKYGVNNKQLVGNINSGNTAVTNISAKFSVTDGTNTKAVNLGKDKNNNVKFLGTDGETTVTVGGNDDAPTVTVGLDAKFKKQVTDNTSNIAENKTNITNLTTRVDGHDTAIENNTKAIGENTKTIEKNTKAIEKNAGDITTLTGRVDTAEKTIGENTKAIGENAKAIGENTKAIGENAKAIGENAKAIGENTKAIGENTKTIGKNTEKIEQNAKDIAAKMTSWTVKAGEEAAGQKIDNTNNAVTFDVAAKDQGLTVTRDGSTIKYGIEGSKIDISENKTVNELKDEIAKKKTVVKAGDENISVTKADDKEEYTVTLAKNLKDLNSVSATTVNAGTVKADTVDTKTVKASDKITVGEGDTVTINNEGLTIKDGPSVKKDGINAGGKTIANVADGKEDSDAVNVKQLKAIENQSNQNISILGGRVSELNTRVNRVGAGAAALAALHPLDFDPDDKWDFSAGYGNYSGANAVAIGAYYRPNEDTMFSVGGSFGGGENMVNAGVSVKLGQGNHVTTSRVAMAKEIKDLRAEVEVLRQAVTGIGQGQTPDPVKMKLFPDIAKNHWAYEAVEELTKQGLLEGYPDGTFGGDRMMTRYEFAEIVYRAMQKGLNVNEKLIQEFEPELERFRIDVISKDKNGNPVIERVRVNEKRKAK